MGDVLKLKGSDAPAQNTEAVAKVVAFLREQADAIESGDARPAHKAVLTIYEDTDGVKFRTQTAFCNASSIERAGLMAVALHDTINDS
jgi:hypothetical protein